MNETTLTEGTKYDGEKSKYDLISFPALDELAQVYTAGAKKYDSRNWEKGIKYSRVIGAIFRHVTAYCMGERKDPETGLHPLAHAAWNCFSLIHYDKTGMQEFDDMPMRQVKH